MPTDLSRRRAPDEHTAMVVENGYMTETVNFGGTRILRSQYDRISAASAALHSRIARAAAGPRTAANLASAKCWREHGRRPWNAADLAAEREAVMAAQEAHPDYREWIALSAELGARIARNRDLGRPLLAYTDADFESVEDELAP